MRRYIIGALVFGLLLLGSIAATCNLPPGYTPPPQPPSEITAGDTGYDEPDPEAFAGVPVPAGFASLTELVDYARSLTSPDRSLS